jgi:predicted amidohydrolase YtcJ
VTPAAELVIQGRILTLAGDHGLAEVEAIAIAGGRVIAAGSVDEIEATSGPRSRRLTLGPGELAMPGLTDSHLHLADAALAAHEVDLARAASLAEGLRLIADAHARLAPDAWLTGHGWDPSRWAAWPTAADLADVAPGRRVALWAHDHHALWVSSEALVQAWIDETTTDPSGGAIRRLGHGRPSGILHEAATGLVTRLIPLPTQAMYEAALPALCADLARLGVVAVHDPGVLGANPRLDGPLAAYAGLADAGRLPVRVHASIRWEALEAAREEGLTSGTLLGQDPSGRARFGWLKLFADGSLGSRTAAMLEPFAPLEGQPGSGADRGLWVTEPAVLADRAGRAGEAGIATQIHGIGDAAVRAALDAFQPAATRSLGLRARVEHAQLVDPADLARFGELGIVASVQPVHLRSDAALARTSWGSRAERSSYAWRSLLVNGATLAFGTDAPVEPIDPWPGLAMAIDRRWPDWPAGAGPFGPAESLTLDEALRAACVGPAEAEGSADRGRLVAGQRADLVVIQASSVEELELDAARLAATRPRLVLVDGQPAFEA